ncbi:Uncharacterized protein APZ42_010756 [Daphnia magna]|uniref:Uncharacterized protein n=1 Tax=Daphnia magna TaxID=35525 RepID=A0A164D834_9CRUS|nr:Uncharacterized protein APZ42_010756 [Daphnia magna]
MGVSFCNRWSQSWSRVDQGFQTVGWFVLEMVFSTSSDGSNRTR